MNWRASLDQTELNEILADAHEAFQQQFIKEDEYRTILGHCGINASDIEDEVRRNAPKP